MKVSSTSLFPLSILTSIAAISLWLLHATAAPEAKNDGNTRHDPDYLVYQMDLKTFDTSGQLQYTLRAAALHHYPDDASTVMTNPHFTYTPTNQPAISISAETGVAYNESKTIQLMRNVQLKREATVTRPALRGQMPDLTINTEQETAYTPSAVVFMEGDSWLKGIGMSFDNRTQQYTLESRASGQFIRTPPTP